MKKILLALSGVVLMFNSCGLKNAKEESSSQGWKEKSDSRRNSRVAPILQNAERFVLNGELTEENVFLGDIETGDVFKLKISGLAFISKFGTAHKTAFALLPGDNKEKCNSGFYSRQNCVFPENRSSCTVEYRDYLETTTEPLDFSEESEGDRLLFKIGSIVYPLEEKRISENGSALEAEFEILPEMVKKGDGLFLVSFPDESEGTFRTGLLNNGDCPENGHFIFYNDAPEEYVRFERKTVRKYLLKLEKK